MAPALVLALVATAAAGAAGLAVVAALAALEPRTRAALLLNALDGYTQAEIGRMLAVPEGTVASWLSRGRATLRRELDPDR